MWKKSIDLLTNIKLGTRVRHVEDGVEGRIVWANAAVVKIQWDDGEKVSWKRAELGAKGVVVIDSNDTPEPGAAEAYAPPVDEPTRSGPERQQQAPEVTAREANEAPVVAMLSEPSPAPESSPQQAVDAKPAKKARTRKPKAESAVAPKKPSALDAAAKVLAEEMRPMGTQELIGLMAAKGYWTSPGGKTPAATLFSAILRELGTKGEAARFVKVGKGQFARRPQA
jgi:hypothetical protein